MATYFIGDVHSCAHELKALLNKIEFNRSKDSLYFTGDLIGRGPYPLETINLIMPLCESGVAFSVMGNHELFYLSVSEGILKDKSKAMITELLKAPNAKQIFNFLSSRPFLIASKSQHFVISHAGIYPKWSLSFALESASALKECFACPLSRKLLLRNMYTDSVNSYKQDDSDLNHWRFSLNVFTRMRFCNLDLSLNYGYSSTSIEEAPALKLIPWYENLQPLKLDNDLPYLTIFGHWAALQGQCLKPNVKALDTGCLWGNRLTCYCKETQELISVPSEGHLVSKS